MTYSDIVQTQLDFCTNIPDLDLYYILQCVSPGVVSISVGEDYICKDHLYEVELSRGVPR